jgi:hypothetical protein
MDDMKRLMINEIMKRGNYYERFNGPPSYMENDDLYNQLYGFCDP